MYLIEDQRWVPREAAFLRPPDDPPIRGNWNSNCIRCHSVDGIPDVERETVKVRDRTTVAEFGVACEACHGRGEEHVKQRRLARDSREKTADLDDSIINPLNLPHERSSQVCGHCHSDNMPRDVVGWLRRGDPYEPGSNLEETYEIYRRDPYSTDLDGGFWADGAHRVGGREFNGMTDSACYIRGNLSCFYCHTLHGSDPDDQLTPELLDGNAACVQCHQKYSEDVEAHTHHAAESSGSLCYNCHMPHTSFALLKAIRGHQIDSPAIRTTVPDGRPNACNLCHLDKTLAWTSEHLDEWFGVKPVALQPKHREVAAGVLWSLSGDAVQRAIIAWHMGWSPTREASRDDWLPPYLAELLDDPYAANRYIAYRSLRRLQGYSQIEYDYLAAPLDRARALADVLKIWRLRNDSRAGSWQPPLLIDRDHGLDRRKTAALSAQRDNRRVEIAE